MLWIKYVLCRLFGHVPPECWQFEWEPWICRCCERPLDKYPKSYVDWKRNHYRYMVRWPTGGRQ